MRTLCAALLLIFCISETCFSQVSYTWGIDSRGKSSKTLDLYLFGLSDDDQTELIFWDAVVLSYEFKHKRFAVLVSRGFTGLAQAMIGVGPEFRVDERKEVGLQIKCGLSVMFMPIQFILIPRYNFTDEKHVFRARIEIGVGFLGPLFGKRKKASSESQHL